MLTAREEKRERERKRKRKEEKYGRTRMTTALFTIQTAYTQLHFLLKLTSRDIYMAK